MDPFNSYAVIEFPGFLRNPKDPRNAIAALGGEDAVRSNNRLSFGDDTRPLGLNLRLGMGASPSNVVAEKSSAKSNLFVLRVTENPRAQPNHNESEKNLAHQPNHTTENNAPVLPVSTTVLGQVTSFTTFRSIADYQFHPRKLIPTARKTSGSTPSRRFKRPTEVAGEALFPVAKKFCKEPRVENIDLYIDRLRPARFLRSPLEYGNTDYWYRQFCANFDGSQANHQTNRPANRALIEDRRSDAKRLEGLFHRVKIDADNVPTRPHPNNNMPMVRGRDSFVILQALIDHLFQLRPIWIRRALFEGIPKNLRSSFKKVIVNAGYCFQGPGPFYHAWIRYGYDPRKDPSSRKYQVLQVRINHPVIIEAAELQQQELGEDEEGHPDDDDAESPPREDDDVADNHPEFKLPSAYQLSPDLPLRKNNFAQLCDIKLTEVAEFCERQQPEETFDRKYGFFTESSYSALIGTIRKSLVKIGTEIVGEHRLPHLLQDFRKFPNEAMRQRRKRLCLKSVIHPNKSPETPHESEPDDVKTEHEPATAQPDPESDPASPDEDRVEADSLKGLGEATETAPSKVGPSEAGPSEAGPSEGGPTEAGHTGPVEQPAAQCSNFLDLAHLDDVQGFDVYGGDDEEEDDSDGFGDEDDYEDRDVGGDDAGSEGGSGEEDVVGDYESDDPGADADGELE